MQAHIEMLDELIVKGVTVDRNEPDRTNGITWRVTFLDDPPAEPLDFAIEVDTVGEYLLDGTLLPSDDITITMRGDGELFDTCVGNHVVPDKALDPGQLYYARVFAENEIGFS